MLKAEQVEKSYKKGGLFSRERQEVIRNVSFECQEGECLGIIGESGSGKSTLGRLILGIEKPDRGKITWNHQNVLDRSVRSGNISAVFQDYTSSINPYFTVEEAMREPIRHLGVKDEEALIDQLLNQVGLSSSFLKMYPHELSGGQAQRVCIARALSTSPKCILLDEAISSLDVSVQVQILELLKELKRIYQMTYVFITHDIQAAAYLCDRVMIFKEGQVVETIRIEDLKDVQSLYAKTLLNSLITL
ncbi:ABC transporter ATP-binding protein [Neobacillus mesonae]|nr:ABC transporter ATP-binding protein [Neobacillus mesonae]